MQDDFKQTEDCDIASDFCQAAQDGLRGDRCDIEGQIRIVVLKEDPDFLIFELRIVLCEVERLFSIELEESVVVIFEIRNAQLPQVRNISNDKWVDLSFVEVPELKIRRRVRLSHNVCSGKKDVIALVNYIEIASVHN